MRVANRNVSRAGCANCTCLPGLLSRTNRRLSQFVKRITNNRHLSGLGSPSRKGSVFTIDAASLCVPEVKEVNTSQRLETLRNLMKRENLGVYIVPSEDQHQSEYVSAMDQRRAFVSGFSGLAGVAIVTRDVTSLNDTPEGLAALATDGRYFSQAQNELDFNWTLLRQGVKGEPAWEQWAVQQAVQLSMDSGANVAIGVDPRLVSWAAHDKLAAIITAELQRQPKAHVLLAPVQENLVDAMWAGFEDVPAVPAGIVKTLADRFLGESAGAKIARIAHAVADAAADALVVSALDQVAWLLNLRGCDIEYNPVFYSYAVVRKDKSVMLFADNSKFDTNVGAALKAAGVDVRPYASFWQELGKLSLELLHTGGKILVDAATASWQIVRLIKCGFELVTPSPIEAAKAVKNSTELAGARLAHLKDGRALIRFFSWLEYQLTKKDELIDEIEADDKLTALRMEEDDFVGLSFATISATGANGAVIHYKPSKGACLTIDPSKLYLNDSGSQFLDGTTDTTRTIHFGTPAAEEIEHYTLVLKGHVALGRLKFPENTVGSLIDSIARQHLWDRGLDYGHGTSHGIGSFLNVHEGPIGIGPRPAAAKNALKPGHLISNEPGYYEDGEYGIRIENVMFVKDSGLVYNGKKFLEFETVTRVPYCRKLIKTELLSPEELAWVNEYHATVWAEVLPSFTKGSVEWNWLKRETSPL